MCRHISCGISFFSRDSPKRRNTCFVNNVKSVSLIESRRNRSKYDLFRIDSGKSSQSDTVHNIVNGPPSKTSYNLHKISKLYRSYFSASSMTMTIAFLRKSARSKWHNAGTKRSIALATNASSIAISMLSGTRGVADMGSFATSAQRVSDLPCASSPDTLSAPEFCSLELAFFCILCAAMTDSIETTCVLSGGGTTRAGF